MQNGELSSKMASISLFENGKWSDFSGFVGAHHFSVYKIRRWFQAISINASVCGEFAPHSKIFGVIHVMPGTCESLVYNSNTIAQLTGSRFSSRGVLHCRLFLRVDDNDHQACPSTSAWI